MNKKKSFHSLLFTVSKLYYTYYLLRLLMMVCTVLIWFLLTVLQESSNLDAIFNVCRRRKKERKIASWFFRQPPPPFLVKSQLFEFLFNASLIQNFFSLPKRNKGKSFERDVKILQQKMQKYKQFGSGFPMHY